MISSHPSTMSLTRTSIELVSLTGGACPPSTNDPKHNDAVQHTQDTAEENTIIPENAIEAIPDGGYGWTVVFACSLLTFWFNGWTGSWGVLQAALLQSQLMKVSTSTISFVGSLSFALTAALGLFSVRIAQLISARYTALIGILLVSLGMLLASFTTGNLGGLFVTAGVLIGIGTSLLYATANSLPVQWFSSKLGTANGLIKLGGGLGATFLSLINQALLDKIGIVWTFRTLGFLAMATGVPAALTIRERIPASKGPFVDLSLFKSLPFVSLFLAGAIGTFALLVPSFFLPLFAHSIGLSASTGAGIVAAFNACTAVGRFGAGFACDRYGPVNMLLLAMSLNAISMLTIWPISSTLAPLIIFAAINGVANGAFFVTMPTAVASIIGPGHASVAMSMSVTGWTGGYLMGSPIAGIIIAATGAERSSSIEPYRAAIFYAGGVALASGIFVLVARLRLDLKIVKKL